MFQSLSLPPASALVPSPNGTLLAVIDTAETGLSLYDLHGNNHGTYTSPDGLQLNVRWLPDSSGVLVWETSGQTNASGALVLLDPQAHVLAQGWNGWDPAASPDGAWVAFTHIPSDLPGTESVEVAPLRGGMARVLAQSAIFLGWQQGNVIYWSQGAIYSVAPNGSGRRLITSTPNGEEIMPPPGGPESSPDGQALMVMEPHARPAVLGGGHLQAPPFAAVILDPMGWVGPHEVLGGSSDDIRVLDIITGAVVQDTGVSIPGDIEAISAPWIVWIDSGQAIHVTNYATKADRDLGPAPTPGPVLPLGQGKFILFAYTVSYLFEV